MAKYTFTCESCGHSCEVRRPISDTSEVSCSKCQKLMKKGLNRVLFLTPETVDLDDV